jgi:hypothetical protein
MKLKDLILLILLIIFLKNINLTETNNVDFNFFKVISFNTILYYKYIYLSHVFSRVY